MLSKLTKYVCQNALLGFENIPTTCFLIFPTAVLHMAWLYAPHHKICYFFLKGENSGTETSKQNSGHCQQAKTRYMRHKYEHSSKLEMINL